MGARFGFFLSVLYLALASAAGAQTTGTIAGTVTSSADGTAVTSGFYIYAFDATRKFVAYGTAAGGTYSIAGLAPGTYYVVVSSGSSSPAFVQQLYSGIPCVAAECFGFPYLGVTGTPIVVTAGATATANFAVDKGGAISGTVTRAADGTPVGGAQVSIYDANSSVTATVVTAVDGSYTAQALPPGTYFARAHLYGNELTDQLFSGIACPAACRIDLGTPITVTANTTTSAVNFNLASTTPSTGQISGHVVVTSQNAPPFGMTVSVYAGSTVVGGATVAADTGLYTVTGLAPGTYYVLANSVLGRAYIAQWFGGVCADCPGATHGTPVVVTGNVNTSGIDFAIDDSGGSISGSLTLSQSVSNAVTPSIDVYNAGGALVRHFGVGCGGGPCPWDTGGLAPGTYYVRTSSRTVGAQTPIRPEAPLPTGGYWVDELFDNIVCVTADCLPTRGTPVVVKAHTNTPNINFTLDFGAQISGKAPNWFFGQSRVDVFDARGVLLPNRADFDQNLGYVARGLPAGTYFLRYHAPSLGVRDVLYKDLPCDGCAVTSGTPVPVLLGDNKTGIDFSQVNGGTISGTVRSSGGQPLSTITVAAYAANGDFVTSTLSMADGSYHLDGGGSQTTLAPGTYYLRTSNQRGYNDQLYNGITCEACDPLLGTPVTVTTGAATAGIDFTLSAGSQFVSGTVTDGNGVALQGVDVLFFTGPPFAPAARVTTNAAGQYTVSVPAGTYYAQTQPFANYTEKIYNNIPCGDGDCGGSVGLATPVSVSSSTVTGINFSLPACTPPTIAPLRLAQAAVGIQYRQTLTTSLPATQQKFRFVSGDLPPGLFFGDDGVLLGTPTAAGSYTFTVAVVDDNGCANTRTYTLDVPACTFQGPAIVTVPASGVPAPGDEYPGTLNFQTCEGAWTVASDVPWIRAFRLPLLHTAPDGSTLHWAMGYAVDPNALPASRVGHITYGSRVMTVMQSGTIVSGPFGIVDAPHSGDVVAGSVVVGGWALDDLQVTRVSIYRDPVAGEGSSQVFIGDATFVDGSRPDVEAFYPTLPFNRRAGWGYLMLSNMLPNGGNGVFNIYVYGFDGDGNRTLLGARTITAANATATAPFGAIDTPNQGQAVSSAQLNNGSLYSNFGWALTPQPKMIPFDGSTIRVLIDGVSIGTLSSYNNYRSDVSTLFPGLKNSGGPVGVKLFDTTTLSEGLHTIAWVVTDDAGATSGIGSRYFTVQNSAWTPALRASSVAQSAAAVPPHVDGVDVGRKIASLATLPLDADGKRQIELRQLQTLVLDLGASDGCAATYDGYLAANGELRTLPVGSSLDRSGTLYWHPGAAFVGTYQFLFVRTTCDGGRERIPITVHIK